MTVSRLIAHFLTGYEEGGVQLPDDLVAELNMVPWVVQARVLHIAQTYAEAIHTRARKEGVTAHEPFARTLDGWLAE